MHRSAVGALSIDVPEAAFGESAEFWRAALGRSTRTGTQHPEFEVIEGGIGGLTGLLQRVGDDTARIHLDIHTDDLEAEVARLVGLGATEVARHGGWAVLSDPSGLVFCVVPAEGDDPLLDGATQFG